MPGYKGISCRGRRVLVPGYEGTRCRGTRVLDAGVRAGYKTIVSSVRGHRFSPLTLVPGYDE